MIFKNFDPARSFVTHLAKHPKRLVLTSIAILVLGFIWHLAARILEGPETDTLAFPRSGALLVIFAIISAFFNHALEKTKIRKKPLADLAGRSAEDLTAAIHQKATGKIKEKLGTDALEKLMGSSPKIREMIELNGEYRQVIEKRVAEMLGEHILEKSLDRNPEILDTSFSEVAEQVVVDATSAREELRDIDEAEVNITQTEIWAGISGTFVWGFGDIVFNLLFTLALVLKEVPQAIQDISKSLF